MKPELLTVIGAAAATWAVLCRLYALDWSRSRKVVIAQYMVLGATVVVAPWLPAEYGKAVLVAGLLLFLLIETPDWRHQAPNRTLHLPWADTRPASEERDPAPPTSPTPDT